tara:strand:- start:1562 stop:2503 length:942 start_codon:yes stop_codon:yes gene_type:complete
MAQIVGSSESFHSVNSSVSINSIHTSDSDNTVNSNYTDSSSDNTSDSSSDNTNISNNDSIQFINILKIKKHKKKSIKTKLIFSDDYNIVSFIHEIINTLKLNNISYTLKKNYTFNCCYSENHICILFNIYLYEIQDTKNEFIIEFVHKKGNKQYLENIFHAIINNCEINKTNYCNKNSILSNPYINNIINDYIKTLNFNFNNNYIESHYTLLYTLTELCSNKDFHIYLINNNTHDIILNYIYNNELRSSDDIVCHILALSAVLELSYNNKLKNYITIENINSIKKISKTSKIYINNVFDNKINKISLNLKTHL